MALRPLRSLTSGEGDATVVGSIIKSMSVGSSAL